jgi:hypothetical protein
MLNIPVPNTITMAMMGIKSAIMSLIIEVYMVDGVFIYARPACIAHRPCSILPTSPGHGLFQECSAPAIITPPGAVDENGPSILFETWNCPAQYKECAPGLRTQRP